MSVLPSSNVLGLVGWISCLVDWEELQEPPCGVAQGEVCGRVTNGVGVMGSIPTNLGKLSVSQVGRGAAMAADGSCALEVMYCKGVWHGRGSLP